MTASLSSFIGLAITGAVIQLTGMTAVGITAYGESFGDILFLGAFALLPMAKLNIGWAYNQGWMVQRMLGKRRPGGLPIWMWAVLLILLALCAAMIEAAASIQSRMPSAAGRIMLFGGGAAFATLWATFMWFAWWKDVNRFWNEYETRVALQNAGWTQEHIDKEITQLRLRGLLTAETGD